MFGKEILSKTRRKRRKFYFAKIEALVLSIIIYFDNSFLLETEFALDNCFDKRDLLLRFILLKPRWPIVNFSKCSLLLVLSQISATCNYAPVKMNPNPLSEHRWGLALEYGQHLTNAPLHRDTIRGQMPHPLGPF